MTATWSLGILAGGTSRRMGRDKADLEVGGGTLLEHVARRLAGPSVPVLVGTDRGGPGSGSGFEVVPDTIKGAGPLASLTALLDRCETAGLLAVPCDLPLLPADIGARMEALLGEASALVFMTGERAQPFPAFLRREASATLRTVLEAGERRALGYREALVTTCVPWESVYPDVPVEDAFLDVNDSARLGEFLARIEPGGRVAGDEG